MDIKSLNPKVQLTICIITDLIGMGSYFFPGIGEFSDIAWAPISAYIAKLLFGNKVAAFAFLEEILPYTDIIPTLTIAYFITRKRTISI